jgi:dTDP-4-dehydrorhamnose reductase
VNVFVAGAEGQLGRALVERLAGRIAWAGGRGALDVRDAAAVRARVREARPDVVVNATAYNAVDAAESDSGPAFAVNEGGALHLARAAAEAGAVMVHVSTNYVFDGAATRPYTEDDPVNPLSVYGKSKRAGEVAVMGAGGPHLVVRTSALFGHGGNRAKGGSFVDRVLERGRSGTPLRIVDDQRVSTTYAPDLAEGILGLLGTGARGLFHVVNEGECTWHALAVEALRRAGIRAEVAALSTRELAAPARRPAYSVLSTARYRSLGLPPLRDWRDALAARLRAGGD